MKKYLDICKEILNEGYPKITRTGVKTIGITGAMFKHDMRLGFPMLTTRKLFFKQSAVETEGFIKGVTSKKWYQERGCKFWDHWANPSKVKYGTDIDSKKMMREEDDLGPIYGAQWRRWIGYESGRAYCIDQLGIAIESLQEDPFNRRIIISAWNPSDLHKMALPPCHLLWQLVSDGEYLDLAWTQRSVDVPVGLPNNILSYGLLLTVIAQTVNLKPRFLVGHLTDVHIYEDQIELLKEQLTRTPQILPEVQIKSINIFTWEADDLTIKNYNHHPIIKYPIAI